MQDQIARTVGALFVSSDGRVLLGLRAPSKKVWPRHWDTIGGRVEDGESLDEALIREVQEEVGVTPTKFRRVASVRERWPEVYGQAHHHIYAVTEWKGGQPTNICNEHTEIRWFTIDEMLLLTSIVDCNYPRYSRLAIDPRPTIAETPRVRLRCWRNTDRDALATMQEDPDVMRDRGGPFNRQQSDAKFDRYIAAFEHHGFTRWAIESLNGDFLGYAGIMPRPSDHPIGAHIDIGWRLVRSAWGYGYATEASRAALFDAFERCGLTEVLAYAAPENLRSQAVMQRLHLRRDPLRDFTVVDGTRLWRGLVWSAGAPL
jgi:RimJ/RimL family protein N-acetyltransferase